MVAIIAVAEDAAARASAKHNHVRDDQPQVPDLITINNELTQRKTHQQPQEVPKCTPITGTTQSHNWESQVN